MNTLKKTIAALCLSGLALTSTPSWAASPRHYVILLDLSVSNPLVRSTSHASNLARLTERQLDLKFGDEITLRTFGVYNVEKQLVKELKVNIYLRPENAKRSVKQLIATVPEGIKKGYLSTQGQTNIIGALQRALGRMDCGSRDTNVIVITDGIENSEYGDMPSKPDAALFKGCKSLSIIGLNGHGPKHTLKLKTAWREWAAAAGFTTFRVLQ